MSSNDKESRWNTNDNEDHVQSDWGCTIDYNNNNEYQSHNYDTGKTPSTTSIPELYNIPSCDWNTLIPKNKEIWKEIVLTLQSSDSESFLTFLRTCTDLDIIITELLLHLFARRNRLDCLKYLIEEKKFKYKKQTTKLHDSLLHSAVESNNPELIEYIITLGDNIHHIGQSNEPPLYRAISSSNWTVFYHLTKNHINNVQLQQHYQNILHYAIESNAPVDIIDYIINDLHINIESMNRCDERPLTIATKHGYIDMVKHLVSNHNADIYAIAISYDPDTWDEYDRTVLEFAAEANNIELVQYYVDELHFLEHLPSDYEFVMFSVLESFIKHNNYDAVVYLLEKCDGNIIRDTLNDLTLNSGDTLLHTAAAEQHLPIIDLLLEYGFDIHVVDRWNKTIFDQALSSRHWAVIRHLISKYNYNYNKNTILFKVLDDNNVTTDVIDFLLVDLNINIEIRHEEYGTTPLLHAASCGNIKIMKYLIMKYNANIHAKCNKNDSTVLHFIIHAKNLTVDMVQFVFDLGNGINNINHFDKKNQTPLLLAVQLHRRSDRDTLFNIISRLIELKSDLKLAIEHSLLHYAADFDDSQYLNQRYGSKSTSPRSLLEYIISTHSNIPEMHQQELLLHVTSTHNFETLKLILTKFKWNIAFINTKTGGNLLHAIMTKSTKTSDFSYDRNKNDIGQILHYLIELKQLDINLKDNNGCTPLLLAAIVYLPFEEIQYMIKNGAHVHAVDNNGNNLVHLLIPHLSQLQSRSPVFFETFARYGISFEAKTYDQKLTPLLVATKECCKMVERKVWVVRELIYIHHVDVNVEDYQKQTALHYVAQSNYTFLMQFFLEHSIPNIDHCDQWNQTPLLLSMKFKSYPITLLLIKANANPMIYSTLKETTIQFAINITPEDDDNARLLEKIIYTVLNNDF